MFVEQALAQSTDLTTPLKVLDISAAPGGKSTHLQSMISRDSLLVSNEVIRSRANVLKDNIIKWGSSNVVVTNNDPKDFTKLTGFFDVLVVDAPCSGSGLFRRDSEAIEEWSENNVALCSQRQQRILADALPALKQDGILVYSTCSYSPDENEEIVDWLCGQFEMESVKLDVPDEWNITLVATTGNNYGYRFWPHLVKGEGFFLSVFRKKADSAAIKPSRVKTKDLVKSELATLANWVDTSGHRFVQFGETVYAWPENLFDDYDFLAQNLKVIYSGTALGVLVRDKLIPDHALAMNRQLLQRHIPQTELDESAAIAYLQRKDININTEQKGWQLATYKGYPLGWMNVLPNRINNYYPKELRILKGKAN